jgi:hypothetical protein
MLVDEVALGIIIMVELWENAWIVQLYCAVDFTIRSQDEGNDRLAGTRNCYRFRKMGSAMADIRN